MAQRKQTGEYSLRSGTSVVAFWIGAVLMAIAIVVPLIRADWRVLTFVAAPALLLTWVLWIALYRPTVQYDSRRAIIVNIGRTHVLPWHGVRGIRQRLGIDFELDGGRVVKAIAVAPPRRPGLVASNFDRRTRPAYDFNRTVEILEGYRLAAGPSDEAVESRWDVVPLTIGAVLVVAVAVEILVGL